MSQKRCTAMVIWKLEHRFQMPANVDFFMRNSLIFSICTQIKNCGYKIPNLQMVKLDVNGEL
jgi:hypothetical protein